MVMTDQEAEAVHDVMVIGKVAGMVAGKVATDDDRKERTRRAVLQAALSHNSVVDLDEVGVLLLLLLRRCELRWFILSKSHLCESACSCEAGKNVLMVTPWHKMRRNEKLR